MSRALVLILLLGACGADGLPERPAPKSSGVTVSGSVGVGITGGSR